MLLQIAEAKSFLILETQSQNHTVLTLIPETQSQNHMLMNLVPETMTHINACMRLVLQAHTVEIICISGWLCIQSTIYTVTCY